ncbi:MAG: CoA-transferase [Pseudomonadota bacterium]
MSELKLEELLIHEIAGLLSGSGHIACGVLSPIPGAAAMLTARREGAKVFIIGCDLPEFRCDGGVELFDQAGQGRVDAFFLSGGQIDGKANINLHGVGDYPTMDVRWSGAFGSAYLYYLVPKVILFRLEHSRRVFPETVDFISSPGVSDGGLHRPGGPHALVTNLCVFRFDRERARFRLASLHPGVSLEEVRDNTGFAFDAPESPAETAMPSPDDLALIRGEIATMLANPYPKFADRIFGVKAAA